VKLSSLLMIYTMIVALFLASVGCSATERTGSHSETSAVNTTSNQGTASSESHTILDKMADETEPGKIDRAHAELIRSYPLAQYSNNEMLSDFDGNVWLSCIPYDLHGNKILRVRIKNNQPDRSIFIGEDFDIQGVADGHWRSLFLSGGGSGGPSFRDKSYEVVAGSSWEQVFNLDQYQLETSVDTTRLRIVKSYIILRDETPERRELSVSLPSGARNADTLLLENPYDLALSCDRQAYLAGESLTFSMKNNNTSEAIGLMTDEFYLERQILDGWHDVPLAVTVHKWNAESITLESGQEKRITFTLPEHLPAGTYRLLKPYGIHQVDDITPQSMISEVLFTIMESESENTTGESGPQTRVNHLVRRSAG
jgi:hypothetical protein